MKFQKEFQISISDYKSFNLFHNKLRLILSSALMILLIPPLCAFIYSTIDLGFILAVSYSITVVFSGLLLLINILLMNRTIKKQYNSSSIMHVPSLLTIDESQINQSNSYVNSTLGWSDIFKAGESKKAICLYISKLQAIVIPKHILSHDEESTIRQLVNTNLDVKKNKLKKR